MSDTTDKYRAPALEKGLDIIELLANHGEGLTQGEVAKALDRSQSEIYRMLSTLVRRQHHSSRKKKSNHRKPKSLHETGLSYTVDLPHASSAPVLIQCYVML